MEAPGMWFPLVLLLAAQMVLGTHGQVTLANPAYSAANIVADLTKCPVPNVLFDKKVFDVSTILGLVGILRTAVKQECITLAVQNLGTCAFDKSLLYSSGCCTKACAAGIQKTVDAKCFQQYTDAVCATPAAEKYKTGLFNAAKRCTNNIVVCKGKVSIITPGKPATTGRRLAQSSSADQATVAGTTNAGQSNTAATQDAAAGATTAATAANTDAVPAPGTLYTPGYSSAQPAATTTTSAAAAAGLSCWIIMMLAAVAGALLMRM